MNTQNLSVRLKVFFLFTVATLSLFFVMKVSSVYASDSSDKDNVLIYANKDGEARGYDLLWKVHEGGTYPQESAVVYKDGVAYVASLATDGYPGNRNLTAIDVSTGLIIDTYEIGSTYATPVIDGNTIYIGTGSEDWATDSGWTGTYGMYSIDISNIKTSGFTLNWYTPVAGGTGETAIVDDSRVYFPEFMGGNFYALNKNDGSQAWVFAGPSSYQSIVSLLHGDSIYLFNGYGGPNSIYKIDKTTGAQVWEKEAIGNVWDNSVAYDSDNDAMYSAFYYGAQGIASYDMNGLLRWQATTNSDSLSFSAYHNNVAFFSDLAGYVYARNSSDGSEKWTTRVGHGGNNSTDISSPTISGGLVFIGSKGDQYPLDSAGRGAFNILNEETGDIVWQYHEPDLPDVMGPPSIVNGILFDNTNNYDVYAFDVGDGAGSWSYNRHDQDNSGYSSDGLITSKYVNSICSSAGSTTTCNINNLYTGRAVDTKIKMEGDKINAAVLPNGDYHIYVDNDTVYLPEIDPLGHLDGLDIIVGDSYNSDIPRISNISQSNAEVLKASYSSTSKNVSLSFDNTTEIDATVDSFKRPFLGAASAISSSGSTVISVSNLFGVSTFNSVGMDVTPSAGATINVAIDLWDTGADSHRRWKENSATSDATAGHVISGLDAGVQYILSIDGNSPTTYTANPSGEITFIYDGGYSEHIFDLQKRQISSGGLPVGFSNQPQLIAGGLNFSINSGANITTNRLVNMNFNSGSDVTKMAISLTEDFNNVSQESYQVSKQFDLCSRGGGFIKEIACPDGEYKVYVKFYTKYGIASEVMTQTINLVSGNMESTAISQSNLNGTDLTLGNSNNSANFVALEKNLVKNMNKALTKRLFGRILLQVEGRGESWYVNPTDGLKYYLGLPADAFSLMRELGLGVSEKNFDSFKNNIAPANLSGRILLRVENHGEAYYVNPVDLKMYYLGRPADAYSVMRKLGLGISDTDLRQIGVGE